MLAVTAGTYYVAGRIGLELAYLDGAVAAVWPPAGLGLALLYLYGLRLWPGIVIGDLLLADFSTPIGTVLAQTVGNTVAIVVAVLLLRRLTDGRASLERVSDVLAFVAAAVVGALISAAFGPLALRAGDVIPPEELGRVFRTWTLGDASGALVRRAGDPHLGEHRHRRASAGARSSRERWSWRCSSRWPSCRRSATCRTSCSPCCCGRRSGSGPAAPRRRSSSCARSRSG